MATSSGNRPRALVAFVISMHCCSNAAGLVVADTAASVFTTAIVANGAWSVCSNQDTVMSQTAGGSGLDPPSTKTALVVYPAAGERCFGGRGRGPIDDMTGVEAEIKGSPNQAQNHASPCRTPGWREWSHDLDVGMLIAGA